MSNTLFIGDFDEIQDELILELYEQIREQKRYKDGTIDLHITSQGGNWYTLRDMVELVEVAKARGIVVRTIVPSMAYSAGSMLAVAGTYGERYIGREADHLVHYGTVDGPPETTPLQSERVSLWKSKGFKSVVNHYKKYCDIPDIEEQIKDDLFFIPAVKCKKWGLADKFIDELEL
jgi:ATP-dependent protease ClpP protease subunit